MTTGAFSAGSMSRVGIRAGSSMGGVLSGQTGANRRIAHLTFRHGSRTATPPIEAAGELIEATLTVVPILRKVAVPRAAHCWRCPLRTTPFQTLMLILPM